MRTIAAPAALLLTGSLLLSGCSVVSGDDNPSTPKASTGKTLKNTAWHTAPAAEVAQGGTLRLGTTAVPRNFNPQHPDAVNTDAARILAPTVGSAIRITPTGSWQVDHDYAESIEVADTDPLTIKVRLNPKAVWQGGTSITAADMKAYWKALNGSDDDYQVASTEGFEDIGSVEQGKTKFDYTVTFKKPNAEWPLYVYPHLAANVSSSPKLFNTAFRTRAISSNGPFLVSSIDTVKGTITEQPNPRWWGAKPKLSKVVFQVAPSDVLAKAFAAGELDAVDLEANTYKTAAKADDSSIERAAGIEWSQVTLNGGRGPLEDPDVRRAVAHAIDRQGIAEQASAAVGAPASPLGSVMLVPGQQGYVDSSASIAYDPDKAADLLTKAGWQKGSDGIRTRKGARLTLTLPVPAKTPANSRRAAQIADDLRKVGIDVKVTSVPADQFFTKTVIPLDFDLVTFVRRGSPFPIGAAEPMFHPVDSAQNYTGVSEERFGKGWDITKGTLDDQLRLKRVAKLDEWVFENPTVIPLAVTPIVVAVRSRLVNYGAAQFEQPDWTIVGFTQKK
ncbi:ABC transporter family substrate-binding protein [Aeromicrobium sp. Root236]|uniref:ABC transporter family substrate-binding protein n=1 Tax=Aeromicrobium sp. Root236 TaxID=1736498 RepID=UPI000A9D0405|nr:ABC transporter family substrate-binding protein [Aeromicrobium sp. Root236]